MCRLSPQLLHVFTIYFKFITKCDKCYYKVRQVLQSVTILLQSATGITKCDKCYYKVRQVLQSATIITECDSTYVLGQHFKLGTIPAEKEVFEKLF